MGIKITEDGAVRYVNENDVDRTMFPNLAGAMGDEQYDALNGRLTVVEGKVSDLEECCDDVNNDITELKNDLSEKADKSEALGAYIVETATGSIASFSDGADGVPVKDLTVAIEPVQSGSGDPSPENVRPISGWTGANVTVNDEVLSVNWQTEAGTVYGGTLDVTTGVLTVDRARIALSTLNFQAVNTHYFFAGVTGMVHNSARLWSDSYKTMNAYLDYNQSYFENCSIAISQSLARIAIRDDSYSDVASFKASLTDKYIVYGLAEPQTYQLTAHEVSTILGQNNIFADCGDSTVQYRADTKLYIDKVLSA